MNVLVLDSVFLNSNCRNIDDRKALDIALGNVDPIKGERFADRTDFTVCWFLFYSCFKIPIFFWCLHRVIYPFIPLSLYSVLYSVLPGVEFVFKWFLLSIPPLIALFLWIGIGVTFLAINYVYSYKLFEVIKELQ